jgi:hypothetical protein
MAYLGMGAMTALGVVIIFVNRVRIPGGARVQPILR